MSNFFLYSVQYNELIVISKAWPVLYLVIMVDDSLESQKLLYMDTTIYVHCACLVQKHDPHQDTTRGSVITVTSLNGRGVSSSSLLTEKEKTLLF